VKKRGRGVAAMFYGIGRTATIDAASAHVELDDGGSVKVLTGATEIGEGILTALAQMAAEEVGVEIEDVRLAENDTAVVPEASHAGASRQTYVIGNAVINACNEAKAKLYTVLAEHWGVAPDDLDSRHRVVWSRSKPECRMSMSEAVAFCKKQGRFLVGSGTWRSVGEALDPENGQGAPWPTYVWGTQIAEVEVDTETGEVQLLKVWAVHDVGKAINPQGVEGQIEGGVIMGMGMALTEEYEMEEGVPKSAGFSKYILPTSLDIPEIECVLIEDPSGLGPHGAKGVGEPTSLPTAPAILNAIYDAIGVRIDTLPASPERVLAALRAKMSSESKSEVKVHAPE
jgi:CO/xanthine dehydrogenase Mo-binding subunit